MRNPLRRLFALATKIASSLAAVERTIDRAHNFEYCQVKANDYIVMTHVTPVGHSISVTFKSVPPVIQWAAMKLVGLKLADNQRFGRFTYLPGRNGKPASYVAPFQ
jgi:hypothetical protein